MEVIFGVMQSANFSKRTFASRAALDAELADAVAGRLAAAIDQRGRALLVVSGGTTPLNFFRLLAGRDLPWRQVTVTLADERWVPPDHADSNQRLVAENLLVGAASAAQFIPLWRPAPTVAAAADLLDPLLAALDVIDVLMLGMGGDGHTASLFPQASALAAGLDMQSNRACIAVDPVAAPHARLSMTLPRLLRSRAIFIQITGAEKMVVLESAASTSDAMRWPVSAILRQPLVPVTVYWSN